MGGSMARGSTQSEGISNAPDGGGAADAPGTWPRQSPWLESGLAQQEFPAGLYVVATPLGNAADVTLRALWVLRLADCIACEDTRTTAPLLARFGIHGRLLALHRHNEAQASRDVLERLARGERVALVSDAGTPAISDPGALLVAAALDAGRRVVPVPGPSSMTAALCVAGIRSGRILFGGFAPARGAARRRHWSLLAQAPAAVLFFEAPHRMAATARELGEYFAPSRRAVIARELTKKFESVLQTTVGELAQHIATGPLRGEYVLVIDAPPEPREPHDAQAIDDATRRWLMELARELPASRAAAVAARASGLPRAMLYETLLDLGRDGA
jgi:16S rRNA (cytidine1402-2'-O)-methyltransferase